MHSVSLRSPVLAGQLFPTVSLFRDVSLSLAGCLFISLCAQVAIPLPPVPVTGQTLGVLLAGIVLGPRVGLLSLLEYLFLGMLGAPVFAGGAGGIAHLVGPTGGYLAGMAAGAQVTGLLAERGWDRHFPTMVLAMMLGNVAIYLCGLPWLAVFVGPRAALITGLYPFLAGDLAKVLLAAVLCPLAWRLAGNPSGRA